MPDNLFTVVAKGHAVDANTNSLTLFSIVEEVSAPEFPAAVPELSVVSLWRRLDGEAGVSFVQRTRLVDPEGKEVLCTEGSFTMDKLRHRFLVLVGMARFDRPGCYKIEIDVRREDEQTWSRAASFPIEVALLPVRSSDLLQQGRSKS